MQILMFDVLEIEFTINKIVIYIRDNNNQK